MLFKTISTKGNVSIYFVFGLILGFLDREFIIQRIWEFKSIKGVIFILRLHCASYYAKADSLSKLDCFKWRLLAAAIVHSLHFLLFSLQLSEDFAMWKRIVQNWFHLKWLRFGWNYFWICCDFSLGFVLIFVMDLCWIYSLISNAYCTAVIPGKAIFVVHSMPIHFLFKNKCVECASSWMNLIIKLIGMITTWL